MTKNKMKEIEAKLKLEGLSIIEKAKLIKNREVQVLDIYFDNDFLQLNSQDKVLRLRRENDKTFIAFKGPREQHEDLIVRDESETEISSYEDALKIVHGLELKEISKNEKIRKYFSIKDFSSLLITIDQYPFIGNFIEIEGGEMEVYAFMEKFGFNKKDTIQKNCAEIFVEYCNENNVDFENPDLQFTFQNERDLTKKTSEIF